jgi:hypothetical protein
LNQFHFKRTPSANISLVERQRRQIEFFVRLGKSGSETLQLTHQAYGDDAMRRAAVFKW